MTKKLLIAIPAYNEEEKIGEVIRNIPGKIKGISKVHVLVIDDGSTDKTAEIADDSGAEVIKNKRNIGYGASFGKALQYSVDNYFDLMVSIDGDAQFDPKDIPKLIEPIIEDEADLVTASRFINKDYYPKMPLPKFWGNKLMSFLVSRLVGKKFYDVSCGFRAYSQKTLLSLNLHGKFTFSQETVISLSFKDFKILEIPIRVKYFPERVSKISSNLFRYGANALKIIIETYRDYKPFVFFSYISLFFFIISIFFGSILLHTYITLGSFHPNIWSGFVGGTFLFISVTFFIVGISADIIKRIRVNQEEILYLLKRNSLKNK
ncbi:MAG: glycosyltransferase family 2 protein [Actinomycetota bacterium]|nr:glycosyltransferase family 2 protein [Actinomycetota bacterium]